MLELTCYPPGFGEPTGSPFATKALCMLEKSGQPYRVDVQDDPRKSPKGKFPVLSDGAKLIPDSEDIRDHLETTYGIDFDEGLTDQERAHSRAIIRMVDEHLYFALLSSRWQNDKHWQYLKAEIFSNIPFPLSLFIPDLIRKGAVKQSLGQGFGRHSFDEQTARAAKDVDAIATTLADNDYLFGKKPTAADYSAIPMLRAMISFPIKTDLGDTVLKHENLVAYLKRGKAELYPVK